MTRHIVWACFGVDADSPEQAKRVVNRIIEANTLERMERADKYRINATVFVSPELDKLVEVAIKKAKKGE